MVTKFRGFTTMNRSKPPFVVEDFQLVKQDLMNVFYTRKGERVMRPDYGSIIWDLLMNPMDSNTEREIRQDVERIINRDPRVDLLNITIIILDHSVRVDITLMYVQLNQQDTLYLNYMLELAGEQ